VRGIAIVEVQAKIHHAKNVTQGIEMYRTIEKKFIEENEKDENVLHEATRCKKTIANLSLWHYRIRKKIHYIICGHGE
jgi:hypothetical protein